ncbi:MAG: DUF4197 domain-containing protein [Motiliproteus sp.]
MNGRRILVTGAALLGCYLIPVSAQAGWGDILKQVEESVPGLTESTADSTINNTSNNGSSLDTDTLVRGLKEALAVGTQRAVDEVAKPDGYLANPKIKVPLPAVISSSATLLDRFGMGALVDQFEVSMNRAAEAAAPQATQYFLDTLKQMSIEDARKIYNGADDAATRYFEQQNTGQLQALLQPVIVEAMDTAQVTHYYQALVKEASSYPLVGDLDLDLEKHVTDKALKGLFVMLAEQEKLIREEPVARTTDLLKQVFGQ